ncbi:MAG: hypothetical protein QHC90_15100 [Shinella sp.]|nr:hypothetical protein [Shinella sp.]
MANSAPVVLAYSRSDEGHRASYMRTAGRYLGAQRIRTPAVFFASAPVLFLMIEEAFALYVFACFWRSLFGRRTVGLLFRPKPALEGRSLRHRVKRGLLKRLKGLHPARTLTIVPFEDCPGAAEIADGWIYDFQLWDLEPCDHERFRAARGRNEDCPDSLAGAVRQAAGDRLVISAIGAQNRRKGFGLLAGHYACGPVRERWLFAFGGKVDAEMAGASAELARNGGFVADRTVSDEELTELYAASDLVWCFYAADYDQASGVLGRAAQYSVPVLVRSRSLSHRLCAREGIAHIDATEETLGDTLHGPLPLADSRMAGERSRRFAASSLATLREALGGGSVR